LTNVGFVLDFAFTALTLVLEQQVGCWASEKFCMKIKGCRWEM